jgi:hypothetical protein
MVANEEIAMRLRNKREGKSLNGYLVCNIAEDITNYNRMNLGKISIQNVNVVAS